MSAALEIAKLRQEVDELREDKARLDWLESEVAQVSRDNFGRPYVGNGHMLIWKTADDLRSAIDSARRAR